MFAVELLPAGRGDCLWVEYGDSAATHRVLIDGGIAGTAEALRKRLLALPEDRRTLELLVVTHIDIDHIAGIANLLREPPPGLVIGDLWFNGRDHFGDDVMLGVRDGERLMKLLHLSGQPWNAAFDGKAAMLGDGELFRALPPLAGGLRLTLLGPTRPRLAALAEHWQDELGEEHLSPEPPPAPAVHEDDVLLGASRPDVAALAASPFKADTSVPNGSSIALLAEFEGKRMLFAGDAYADDILTSVRALAVSEKSTHLEIDALKLSHHGGRKNTNRELLDALACKRFLISSNGTIYNHPQPEAVARVILHGRTKGRPELWFNYRSDENVVWDDAELFDAPGASYEPLYPDSEPGIRVAV